MFSCEMKFMSLSFEFELGLSAMVIDDTHSLFFFKGNSAEEKQFISFVRLFLLAQCSKISCHDR